MTFLDWYACCTFLMRKQGFTERVLCLLTKFINVPTKRNTAQGSYYSTRVGDFFDLKKKSDLFNLNQIF